ncbi:structural protein [Yersinia phage YerA41]|nr:structural protein [Yersinia phage YerA41]
MAESIAAQLLRKLKSPDTGKLEEGDLYDLNGNVIGSVKDGKVTLEGNNVSILSS